MAALGKTYTAGDVDTEQRDHEDLPAGIMRFEIEASEIVETGPEGDRTGNGLKYTANVLEPEEVAGRKFFGFINLENKSTVAQEIGQREFACLRRAVGLEEVSDSEELHLIGYTVKLGLGKPSKKVHPAGHAQAGQPQYPARMEVKRYYFPDEGNLPEPALDAAQPAQATRPAPATRTPANNNTPAATTGNRPWGKKVA